ncbi:hypothetical protein B0J14DRAFT_681124 [Halenospora varia]|nr:hypothetical protein B0J14DRAFT_681124 [Halenospora varia]
MSDRAINARSSRLRNLFANVLSGKQGITDANTSLFLEAICDQSDPATCIQRLVSSGHGFLALQSALRINTSPTFLNGPLPSFLRYLQAPELKSICGGDILRQVISKIVEPPYTWNAFIEAVKSNQINEDGLDGFLWLLL